MRGHSKPQRGRTRDRRAEGGKAGDRWGNGEYSVSIGILGNFLTLWMKYAEGAQNHEKQLQNSGHSVRFVNNTGWRKR